MTSWTEAEKKAMSPDVWHYFGEGAGLEDRLREGVGQPQAQFKFLGSHTGWADFLFSN